MKRVLNIIFSFFAYLPICRPRKPASVGNILCCLTVLLLFWKLIIFSLPIILNLDNEYGYRGPDPAFKTRVKAVKACSGADFRREDRDGGSHF